MSRVFIQHLVQDSGYCSKYDQQRLVQDSAYYSEVQDIIQRLVQDSGYFSKMSRVLFSVWSSIQGIIQNTTSCVWFRIQRTINKYPGYYSAFSSGFSVLLKNVPRILISVWFTIRGIIQNANSSVWFRIQRII